MPDIKTEVDDSREMLRILTSNNQGNIDEQQKEKVDEILDIFAEIIDGMADFVPALQKGE